MAQLINFDNFKPNQKRREEITISPSAANYLMADSEQGVDHLYQLTLDILVKSNPNKIVFTIKEAARILCVGEELIRRRIKSGVIKATYLGDKPFINIVELARIITEGA